jgi:hypothetical protein
MIYTRVKYQGESPLNNQDTLKKYEGQEGKMGPVWLWVPVGGGG